MANGIILDNFNRAIDVKYLVNTTGAESVEIRDANGLKISDAGGNGAAITSNGAGSLTLTGSLAVTSTFTVAGSTVTTEGTSAAKAAVRAATTGNITLSAPQTIDGVSVIAGERVLVKDQTTGADNGIYVVAAGAWTRATDADTTAEVPTGTNTFVSEGTANGNKVFHLTNDGAITLGTTSLVFSNLAAASTFSGDMAATSNGFLSDSNGTDPVEVRDVHGFKIGDASGNGGTFIANSANSLRLNASLDLQRTAGLTLTQDDGTTTGGTITPSAIQELSITANNKLKLISSEVELTGATTILSTTSNSNLQLNPHGTGIVTISGFLALDSRNPSKNPVRASTTGNLAATRSGNILTATANGTLAAQDGVTLIVADRILVKDQSTGADNGIYTVTDVGSGGTPFQLTRATDFDATAEAQPGANTFVSEGTVNGNKTYTVTSDAPITLNTTSLVFQNLVAASSFTGDVGSGTSQGFLDNTSGGTVQIRDTQGLELMNDGATLSVILKNTATTAELAILGKTFIKNAGETNSVSLEATGTTTLTIDGSVVIPTTRTLRVTDLGTSRVIYGDNATAGLLASEAGFEYNSTTNTLTVPNATVSTAVSVASAVTLNSSGVTTNDLQVDNLAFVGRVPFVNGSGVFQSDADLKFVTDTLQVRKITGFGGDADQLRYVGNRGMSWADSAGNEGTKLRVANALTTDATVTSLLVNADADSFLIADATAHSYIVNVSARCTAGTEIGKVGFWRIEVIAKASAGAAAIVGSEIKTVIAKEVAGWDVNVDVSGDDIRFRVTGTASQDITWRATITETTLS